MSRKGQIVVNGLWRTRLSRRRMLWLLPHLPVVSSTGERHTGRLRRTDIFPSGEGWGRGGLSQIIRQRESLVLYNTKYSLGWCPSHMSGSGLCVSCLMSAGTVTESVVCELAWIIYADSLRQSHDQNPVLRIQIRDPVPFWPLDPDPGSQTHIF